MSGQGTLLQQTQDAPSLRHGHRAEALALAAAGAFLLAILSHYRVLDLDLFHQMALFRAALELGFVPDYDLFAYTPTLRPLVHYEWGSGALFYALYTHLGTAGLMALRYGLILATAALAARCAMARGASRPALALLSPLAVLLGISSFTTVLRAQLFSLFFLALLLLLIEHDRKGRRLWVAPWLAGFALWVNLHPGFVLAMALLGLHWLENLLAQRRLQTHLLLAGLAMLALLLATPYGRAYPPVLWHSIWMPRPRIAEWGPIWQTPLTPLLGIYLLSLALLAYALRHGRWRAMPGLALLLLLALLAGRHVRHLSIYALLWFCYVPAYLTPTPLGQIIHSLFQRRPRPISAAAGIALALCLGFALQQRAWRVWVPDHPADRQRGAAMIYPVSAVKFLKAQNLRGNLMTHFNDGPYVLWHLHPVLKVALDARYEAAFPLPVVEEILGFYEARPGWAHTLDKWPTDYILLEPWRPIQPLLAQHPDWRCIYRDGTYEIYARSAVQQHPPPLQSGHAPRDSQRQPRQD